MLHAGIVAHLIPFLSTLPARGATDCAADVRFYGQDFYPRSPRGERPRYSDLCKRLSGISIHAPREGSDVPGLELSCPEIPDFYPRSPRGERPIPTLVANIPEILFLSTLPARGATGRHRGRHPVRHHFYPRSPRGERRSACCFWISVKSLFLSTLPARGATERWSMYEPWM